MIVLRAVGDAQIATGVATLRPSQEIVFAAALYLCIERGKRISRATLSALLWPNVAQPIRAHRFRQTLLQLKKLGVPIESDRDTVRLAKDSAETDFDCFPTILTANRDWSRRLEFLPGYEPESDLFRDWLDHVRLGVHAMLSRTLVEELRKARLRTDWASVETIAGQLLTLDPFNEIAVLARAESVAMRGGKLQAIAILDHFIAETGDNSLDLRLPASVLRKRVSESLPEAIVLEDPPFIGRECEMAAINENLLRAKLGRGSLSLVTGQPGIGKSRLCNEIARFAKLEGFQIQRIACSRADAARPLSVFVDIVPQLTELRGALGCSPDTLNCLKRLTEYDSSSSESVKPLDSEHLFQRVQSALIDLLDAVADERALLLVVEDIHWLDRQSAKLLLRIGEWAESKRLMLLLNGRNNEQSFSDYSEKAWLTSTELKPLDQQACLTLMRSITGGPGTRRDEFTLWCLAVSEGNPFFLQELVRHWIETGDWHEAPPSIARVLEDRLSRVDEVGLQVLQAASVLGEYATLERVEKVLQLRAHQLLSAVEGLSKSAMLRLTPTQSHLQPRHDLIASAALSRMAPLSHAFLHRRSAEVLESESEQNRMPAALLWACANHRHHAGDRLRALTLSKSCGEHLLDLGLPIDADAAFKKSLEYCVTDDERLSVLPRIAIAHQMDGKWEACKEVLANCIKLSAKSSPESGVHNEFELQLLETRHLCTFEYKALLNDTLPCVRSSRSKPLHRVLAAVLALKIATDIGPAEVIDSIYEEVSPLLFESDVPEETRLELEIIYQTLRGSTPPPIVNLRRFSELALSTGGKVSHFKALITCASSCRISGRLGAALQFVSEASNHAKSHKIDTWITHAGLANVRIHIAAGQLDEAAETLGECVALAVRCDDHRSRTESFYLETRIALETGDIARAANAFQSIQDVSSSYSAGRRGYAFALAVLLRTEQGADKSVLLPLVEQLEDALSQIHGIGEKDFEFYALYVGLARTGRQDRGLSMLHEYTGSRRSQWPLCPRIRWALDCPEHLRPRIYSEKVAWLKPEVLYA